MKAPVWGLTPPEAVAEIRSGYAELAADPTATVWIAEREGQALAIQCYLVDPEDVAQVAAIVLAEPWHAHATYELAGTPGLSQDQVAMILSQQLGVL